MCILLDRQNQDGKPITWEDIEREVLELPVDIPKEEEHMDPSDPSDSSASFDFYLEASQIPNDEEHMDTSDSFDFYLEAFQIPDEKRFEYHDYTIEDDDSYLDKFISKHSSEPKEVTIDK